MLPVKINPDFDQIEPLLADIALVIALITTIRAVRPARARDILCATATSLVFILPFILLELVKRRSFNEQFPFGLFAGLWLVSFLFVFILWRILSDLRHRASDGIRPADTVIRFVSLALLAWLLVNLIQDQMPCFLGIPVCD